MNEIPDINVFRGANPVLTSPNSSFSIQFEQTKETLMDVEEYKRFLENAISLFRKSITYKHYKGYLMRLGMDKCQFHASLKSSEDKKESMVTLEMHHTILTIFDIALIITEHILNTRGSLTVFDLIHELKKVHKENKVALVMLSKTSHQLYHNTDDFYIAPSMTFGNWWAFLTEYRCGITIEIANKLIWYLTTAIEKDNCSDDGGLLNLREAIKDWSYLNDLYFK